jgi:hypothetical protein
MSEDIEYVCFEDAFCDHETDLALHIITDDMDFWVPKSVVGDDSEVYEDGDRGDLYVPEWFATKEGLI